MIKEITTEKTPIKLWLDDIEEGGLQQAKNIANLPFVYKWIAIMPDSHQGYGMPIGGVVALDNVISPNMVGVDIGCGMCTVNTHLKEITETQLKEIIGRIREIIPVGFKHHDTKQEKKYMPELNDELPIVEREYASALKQIGTLGGGNHFIELQMSDTGEVWIMVHSGSRNIGKQVCDYYNSRAVQYAYENNIPNVVKQDIAYFPADSKEGQQYIKEMQYCVDFAFANRKLMMERAIRAVEEVMNPKRDFEPMINIAHNYAKLETHYGKEVWVHRKGATSARKGEKGIIPGSMGTKSYITEGLGNPESFMSCSHGAGRKMSRHQADRTITLEEANKAMEGIVYGRWNKNRRGGFDFSEAPQAYKDINIVIENQKDLVKIIATLRPLAVVKG